MKVSLNFLRINLSESILFQWKNNEIPTEFAQERLDLEKFLSQFYHNFLSNLNLKDINLLKLKDIGHMDAITDPKYNELREKSFVKRLTLMLIPLIEQTTPPNLLQRDGDTVKILWEPQKLSFFSGF